jgi:PAS domain S-box-containing protein
MIFETITSWPQQQGPIFIAIGVIALQSGLITTLLIQYFRRKRAEGCLKKSEDRWRSLVDNPMFGISILDEKSRFIATNPTYQRMIGYTDEELRQLTPLDISVSGEREVNAILIEELQHGERQHYEMVKQSRRKDGKLIWIQLYAFAFPGAETNAQFIFGMMQDITEFKRSQDALEATRAELARVERMNRLGAMTASIAHEINQPLTAMVANSNAALRWLATVNPDLDEARAALTRIANDGHRAAEVVQSIRAMFNNDGLKRGLLDVNQLIREVLELVERDLFKRRIAVETELNGDLPRVVADRVQLQQVLMNLITNAIDAMGSVTDRPQILRVKSETRDGESMVVAIEDSGVGIDAGKRERLFDTFFTTKHHGMGLGLSICRSIIEAHNGRLWASAGTKYGSVFQFELPIEARDNRARHPQG